MCAHDFIMRGWKLDGTSAEPDALTNALRVCRETVLSDRAGELGGWTTRDVREAAFYVERTVQRQLRELGGCGVVVPRPLARRIVDAQWQAHEAVASRSSRVDAKALQKRGAAGRAPLTVCVGRRQRRFKPNHETVMRLNASDMFTKEHEDYVPYVPLGYGDGCGLIIVDTSDTRPSPPRKYCDRCGDRAGNTMNAGLAKNALARLRAARKLG
jgi:hypothetical protein